MQIVNGRSFQGLSLFSRLSAFSSLMQINDDYGAHAGNDRVSRLLAMSVSNLARL
jgi:hypothetical protein